MCAANRAVQQSVPAHHEHHARTRIHARQAEREKAQHRTRRKRRLQDRHVSQHCHDVQRRIDGIQRRLVAVRRLNHDRRDKNKEDARHNQAQKHRPRNVAQRITRLIAERGRTLEADQAEDRDHNAKSQR